MKNAINGYHITEYVPSSRRTINKFEEDGIWRNDEASGRMSIVDWWL
jgi:hypothetical protein